jgi:hypothetical protein
MEKLKYPNKNRSELIVQWLLEHPLISRSALSNLVGYDPDNFLKAFTGARAIPAKYLDEFEAVLEKYGYKKPR